MSCDPQTTLLSLFVLLDSLCGLLFLVPGLPQNKTQAALSTPSWWCFRYLTSFQLKKKCSVLYNHYNLELPLKIKQISLPSASLLERGSLQFEKECFSLFSHLMCLHLLPLTCFSFCLLCCKRREGGLHSLTWLIALSWVRITIKD